MALDNNMANLYISWKEDGPKHYPQVVDSFVLSSPGHFLMLHQQVRNILDWGKGERLKQTKEAFDIILKEKMKMVAGYGASSTAL